MIVVLLNENRPSTWDQVSDLIDKKGSVTNADVRQVLAGGGVLEASKQLRAWVQKGLLVVVNPDAAKQHRRYTKPGTLPEVPLFSSLPGKQDQERA